MISCPNIKSSTYDGNNTRSETNARWENIVNIDLRPGDLLNMESATLHVRGISIDSTVELTNSNNNSGMSDSKLGFRFTGYVNDNGQNTVAHPFVGADNELSYPLFHVTYPEFYNMEFDPENDDLAPYFPITFIGPSAYINNGDDGNAPPNAGELVTSEKAFEFSYDYLKEIETEAETMVSPFNDNLKTYYGEKPCDGSWNSISGHKYTLVSEDYLGPYRNPDNPAQFNGPEIEPQYFDVKVDLNGPLYESPSTIANEINHQLNNSDYFDASDTAVRDSFNQEVKLPSLTGKLLKVRKCNGFIPSIGRRQAAGMGSRSDFWSQLERELLVF